VRRYWRPFLLLQSAALLLVIGYYTSPAVRAACERASVVKRESGLVFSAIAAAAAGAFLPEAAKAIVLGDRQLTRQRARNVAFAIAVFALNGVVTDLQYRGIGWIIGSDTHFATAVKKTLFDQFITTPLYGVPYWVVVYELRARRYNAAATLRQFSPRWYTWRVLPLLIPAWAYWIPVLLLVYSLPGPLQFFLFCFALGGWSLLMVFVATHEAAGAAPAGGDAIEPDSSAMPRHAAVECSAGTICPMESPQSPAVHLAGVIFDLDGVLADSEPWIRRASMQMFQQVYGVSVRPEDFDPFVGAGEDRFIGGVAEKHGVHLTMPRDKQTTYDIYLSLIRGQMQPVRGALAFVADCRRRGLKLAIASSADDQKVDGNLKQLTLSRASFDAVITGTNVTRKKPDPEIFLAAAAALHLPVEACMVVEDAINGVQAAKAAGCLCLALTTSFPEEKVRAAGADYVARDFDAVPTALVARMPPPPGS
jgi:beta-phosphoglucomutase